MLSLKVVALARVHMGMKGRRDQNVFNTNVAGAQRTI